MIINNLKIVTPTKIIERGYLKINNGFIVDIVEGEYKGNDIVIDGLSKIALPGFIDVHTHGINGIDFMDASINIIREVNSVLYKEGVTSYLLTTVTGSFVDLDKACLNVKEAIKNNDTLLGIHLEGPFISSLYKGAQNEEYICPPNIDMFDKLNKDSGFNIKYITLAPELNGASDFINKYSKDLVISAGHTGASFNDIENATKLGLTNITHMYNAMNKGTHKKPGVEAAAYYFNDIYTEIICDGVHVHEDMIKTLFKIKDHNHIILITDSLKAKGVESKCFSLNGVDCEQKNDAIYIKGSDKLAGSILTMEKAIKNVNKYVKGISLIDIAKISSTNAATCLHLKDRGEISKNKVADIVLLDDDLTVSKVYKSGIEVYRNVN